MDPEYLAKKRKRDVSEENLNCLEPEPYEKFKLAFICEGLELADQAARDAVGARLISESGSLYAESGGTDAKFHLADMYCRGIVGLELADQAARDAVAGRLFTESGETLSNISSAINAGEQLFYVSSYYIYPENKSVLQNAVEFKIHRL